MSGSGYVVCGEAKPFPGVRCRIPGCRYSYTPLRPGAMRSWYVTICGADADLSAKFVWAERSMTLNTVESLCIPEIFEVWEPCVRALRIHHRSVHGDAPKSSYAYLLAPPKSNTEEDKRKRRRGRYQRYKERHALDRAFHYRCGMGIYKMHKMRYGRSVNMYLPVADVQFAARRVTMLQVGDI